MVLWTPNRKTVEPVELCPRCGGYERRVADRRDFNRYLSLHRICCCNNCENILFDITLSDVEAGICASCESYGINLYAKTTTLSSVDGTYTDIPIDGYDGFGTGFDISNYVIGSCSVTTTFYTDSSCTSFDSSQSGGNMKLNMSGDCDNGNITIDSISISVDIQRGGIFINDPGEAPFSPDEYIDNAVPCNLGSFSGASGGGTAYVEVHT